MLEKIEQVPSVPPIGLRLAHDHRPDLPRFPDEDSVAESVHEGMKPLRVAGGLNADRHRRGQRPVEPLHGVPVVGELLLQNLARAGVENRDLLLTRVQVS